MTDMFNATTQGPYGDTIYLPKSEVKIRAYKAANHIADTLRRNYTLTTHADESITVTGDGLEPCTYAEYPKDN